MPRLLSASSDHELSGKSSDEGLRLREELVVSAELAQRAQIEEARFGLARRRARDRAARRRAPRRSASGKVALGDAQIDELAIVADDLGLERGERRPRIGVAPRAEQLHGAARDPACSPARTMMSCSGSSSAAAAIAASVSGNS